MIRWSTEEEASGHAHAGDQPVGAATTNPPLASRAERERLTGSR
jgi:hypothetical protein